MSKQMLRAPTTTPATAITLSDDHTSAAITLPALSPTAPHQLLLSAHSIDQLQPLSPALYTTDKLVGVPFEQIIVASPSEDHLVLYSVEVCDCVCVGIRTNNGTRILAHKQLDRDSVESFVRCLLQCVPVDSFALSSQHAAEYVLVGGHDDTRQLVNTLVTVIDALTHHRWRLTHRQLFGVRCTRTLAMVADRRRCGRGDVEVEVEEVENNGFYKINFEMVPSALQRIFSLESMLSIKNLSEQQRKSLIDDLQREREEEEEDTPQVRSSSVK